MASKFSHPKKTQQNVPVSHSSGPETTEPEVMKLMPEFLPWRERDLRERRKNHGIPEDKLLALLKLNDPKLTAERLKELVTSLQIAGSIEYGLFPTSMGSEQGWRRTR